MVVGVVVVGGRILVVDRAHRIVVVVVPRGLKWSWWVAVMGIVPNQDWLVDQLLWQKVVGTMATPLPLAHHLVVPRYFEVVVAGQQQVLTKFVVGGWL